MLDQGNDLPNADGFSLKLSMGWQHSPVYLPVLCYGRPICALYKRAQFCNKQRAEFPRFELR